jgi:GcrA cell cycle regulator
MYQASLEPRPSSAADCTMRAQGEAMRGEQDPQWTDDQVALLQKWWDERVTASAIAERLGVTRSAVLGKINRLRRLAAEISSTKAGKSDAADELSSHGSSPQSPARRRCGERGQQSEDPRPKVKARGKRLLELTNNCCRWPLGNPATARFWFCGIPEANLELGVPYCRSHSQRAYLKLRHVSRKKKLGVVSTGEPAAAPQT